MARNKPDAENARKVVNEGSTLGNIAREYGNVNIGRLMDEDAMINGDVRDDAVKGADHHHVKRKGGTEDA